MWTITAGNENSYDVIMEERQVNKLAPSADFEDIRVGWIKALRPNPQKNAHMLIPLNKGEFASLNPPYN